MWLSFQGHGDWCGQSPRSAAMCCAQLPEPRAGHVRPGQLATRCPASVMQFPLGSPVLLSRRKSINLDVSRRRSKPDAEQRVFPGHHQGAMAPCLGFFPGRAPGTRLELACCDGHFYDIEAGFALTNARAHPLRRSPWPSFHSGMPLRALGGHLFPPDEHSSLQRDPLEIRCRMAPG